MKASWVKELELAALYPDRQATVAMASLPVPKERAAIGFEGIASQAVPLAWYEGKDGPGLPRHWLLLGVSGQTLPDDIRLKKAVRRRTPAWTGPKWRVDTLSQQKTGIQMREVNELVLEQGRRRLGLRLGLQQDHRYRWWEWVRIEELWAGPVCRAVRAAGYVGAQELSDQEFMDPARYNHGPWLHKHNWLFVEIYALTFVNGLVKVTARHVNNRLFDQGRDLENLVPVIGFHLPDEAPKPFAVLDGTNTHFPLGAVQLDISPGAPLISPEHPGALRPDGDLLVLQPYEGVEINLGKGEPAELWKLEAAQRAMWKGMARSVEFDLSLADAPIQTQRYLAPYGWYGHAGGLWPEGTLPARGRVDLACDRNLHQTPAFQYQGRFSPNSFWEGEWACALMMDAYRTGRSELYDAAIRDAYAVADVGIDHADFTIRIGDQMKHAVSLTLQRTTGLLAVYLETGDPYLLRCAESISDNAYTLDRSNWPRRSFGRDAAYIRGMVRLYDITGERFYLRRAGEACRRAAQCQRPDGSFADQGGTFGAHGHLNEIVKPWMNSILLETYVFYLERAGTDSVVERSAVRTADWLLSVLQRDKDGAYWPYEVAWGDNPEPPWLKWYPDRKQEKHPYGDSQLDYNAKSLLWITQRTGDPKYARAWMDTFERNYVKLGANGSLHGETKIAEDLPWHESQLWGARWLDNQLKLQPILDLLDPGREAKIELPYGGTAVVSRTKTGVEVGFP